MSLAPRHPEPSPRGYNGLRMTAEEFLSLGETNERYELIDGVVFMSPSAMPNHSEIINEIIYQLKAHDRRAEQIRVFSETDILFDAALVYRPDVAVYQSNRLERATPRLELPPDLIIEVLSPHNRSLDLITKRHDYNRYGVAEYWIVDPEAGHIRALQRRTPQDAFTESAATGAELPSAAIPGFALELAPVLALMHNEREA